MLLDCIDHVVVPVSNLEAAAAPYERLGLNLTPKTVHANIGTENRVFMVGQGHNDFFLELLGIRDRTEMEAAGRTRYLAAAEAGSGIARVMVGVTGIAGAVEKLRAAGVQTEIESVHEASGRKICDVAPIEDIPQLGFAMGLVEYTQDRAAQHERRAAAGRFDHGFPLKRADHFATIVTDLDAATRFWVDVLQVPVFGEVRGPGIIIQQMKVGDSIIELLAADGPESRLQGRPPGLSSMVAWEVPVLDDAVALARERGFAPSEPAKGILPGTRVATIPGSELAGVGMQLLEYV